jgi:hypothetical protein
MKSPDRYSPSGQCCELDEPYQAPPGYFDQPFIYTFDADNLVGGGVIPNGQDVRNAGITTYSGADFILRRVAGIDRVCTQFQLRDVLARLLFDANSGVQSAGFYDFPLNPEFLYPAAAGITFDLLNVQKAVNTSGNFLSQIAFQGVRRFRGYRRPPSYPYWEDPFDYLSDVTINWTDTQPRTYVKNIYDFDFELLTISAIIINPPGGGPPAPCSGIFKIQLYDQVYEKTSFTPILDDLLIDNGAKYQGVNPVPGIVYRISQQIKFDFYSLVVPAACPLQVQIRFRGVRRRPC